MLMKFQLAVTKRSIADFLKNQRKHKLIRVNRNQSKTIEKGIVKSREDEPEVLNRGRTSKERIENANGLGPVLGAA